MLREPLSLLSPLVRPPGRTQTDLRRQLVLRSRDVDHGERYVMVFLPLASWARRWGRRPIVALTTAAGSFSLVVLPMTEGWLTFPVALATGALLGAAHSILIVVAQALLPVRQGLASGIALGYFFGIGAVASVIIGALSDVWSLAPVIQAGAVFGLAAAALSLLLPKSRHV